jgi:hypothetical protein
MVLKRYGIYWSPLGDGVKIGMERNFEIAMKAIGIGL